MSKKPEKRVSKSVVTRAGKGENILGKGHR